MLYRLVRKGDVVKRPDSKPRTMREVAADYLHNARCTDEVCKGHTREDLTKADEMIAAMPGGGLIVGGDYPRDEATRSVVANALAVATLLDHELTREPSLTEKKLITAADRWKQVHGKKRT